MKENGLTFLLRSSVFKSCGVSEGNSLSGSIKSCLSARKGELEAEHTNTAGRAEVSPVPQPPGEPSKAGPVGLARIRHSPMNTRQVPGDKAGLGPGWKSSPGQGLGPQQWVQSQGQARLQLSRSFSSDGGPMEGARLKSRSYRKWCQPWLCPRPAKERGSSQPCKLQAGPEPR